MKRIILFSNPVSEVMDKVLIELFPSELDNKVLAYMPCDGADNESNIKYTQPWIDRAKQHNTIFNFINNSKSIQASQNEHNLIMESNILLITGGNTYTLLRNLRRSGLDKAILEFAEKDNFILSGFSAGAIILTPTIELCEIDGFDENTVGLNDFTGLNLIDFEVFPHYKREYKKYIVQRQEKTTNKVVPIPDDQLIVINK